MSKHASPHGCLVCVLGEKRWRVIREENIPEVNSEWVINHAMVTCSHSQKVLFRVPIVTLGDKNHWTISFAQAPFHPGLGLMIGRDSDE